jgi:hypothetical protein
MPADFLSRNMVNKLNITAVELHNVDLLSLQKQDPFISSLSRFIKQHILPPDPLKAAYI